MTNRSMEEQLAKVTEAFNRKASIYDQFGENHPNLQRMRQKVRRQVHKSLPNGGNILEINAGTGEDAVYFAQHGYSVLATDISPNMVGNIKSKIINSDLASNLKVRRLSFTHLDQIEEGPFDLVLSNMGGLNCLQDLQPVTRHLPKTLHKGSSIVWVIMPDLCLWELGAALVGDFQTARRRRSRQGVLAHIEGVHFTTYYHTPKSVLQAFGDGYRMVDLQGLSVFTPPADWKNFAHRYPSLYRILAKLDDTLSDLSPFNRWGDFYMLTMEYVGR